VLALAEELGQVYRDGAPVRDEAGAGPVRAPAPTS
jgi:hypothetical protein